MDRCNSLPHGLTNRARASARALLFKKFRLPYRVYTNYRQTPYRQVWCFQLNSQEATMLNPGGLSDKKLEEACSGPLYNKTKVFGKAVRWLKANRNKLKKEHAGKHICIDVSTLVLTVGKTHKAAVNKQGRRGQPRSFVCDYFPAPSKK